MNSFNETIEVKRTKMMSSNKAPFCGVCYKAGKTKDVYTNHWTRETPDPKSKVTCPTILNTVCKYCKEKGHTMKYCRMLNDKKSRNEVNKKEHKKERDTGNDVDGYVKITPLTTKTWASVAMMTKPVKRLSLIHPDELKPNKDDGKLNEPSPIKQVVPSIVRSVPKIKDWSEYTDDEEEIEYDYAYEYDENNRPCSPIEPPY